MSGTGSTTGRPDDGPPNLDLAALHIAVAELFAILQFRAPTEDEVLSMVADMRERAREEWRQEAVRHG